MKNADFHDRLVEAMKIRSVSAKDEKNKKDPGSLRGHG